MRVHVCWQSAGPASFLQLWATRQSRQCQSRGHCDGKLARGGTQRAFQGDQRSTLRPKENNIHKYPPTSTGRGVRVSKRRQRGSVILGDPWDQVHPGLTCAGKDNVCTGPGRPHGSLVFMVSHPSGSRVARFQIQSPTWDPASQTDSLRSMCHIFTPRCWPGGLKLSRTEVWTLLSDQ